MEIYWSKIDLIKKPKNKSETIKSSPISISLRYDQSAFGRTDGHIHGGGNGRPVEIIWLVFSIQGHLNLKKSINETKSALVQKI